VLTGFNKKFYFANPSAFVRECFLSQNVVLEQSISPRRAQSTQNFLGFLPLRARVSELCDRSGEKAFKKQSFS
jgi:hypothetical protein